MVSFINFPFSMYNCMAITQVLRSMERCFKLQPLKWELRYVGISAVPLEFNNPTPSSHTGREKWEKHQPRIMEHHCRVRWDAMSPMTNCSTVEYVFTFNFSKKSWLFLLCFTGNIVCLHFSFAFVFNALNLN